MQVYVLDLTEQEAIELLGKCIAEVRNILCFGLVVTRMALGNLSN